MAVHPYRPTAQLPGQLEYLAHILGPDACGKAVDTVIGHQGNVFEGVERLRHNHGSKYLLASYAHGRRNIREHRGLDVIPRRIECSPPRDCLRAAGDTFG